MLMRKETLDKVGLLDETFFMYGEDIDLSYRILLGGYKNYYFADTNIIHYKGESTKKSSVNYVFVFYRAMVIFAQKHFSKNNAKLFSILINVAIYLRASLAIMVRFLKKSFLPVFDFASISLILYLLSLLWKNKGIIFPIDLIKFAFPAYTLTWLTSLVYAGLYDYPTKIANIFKGTLFGTLIILVIYGLLPKEFQFSRLFIVAGTLTTISFIVSTRFLFSKLISKKFSLNGEKPKSFALVGSSKETSRVAKILNQSDQVIQKIVLVSPNTDKKENEIGIIDQLDQIQLIHKIDEIIFCAKDVSSQQIISWMNKLANSKVLFKIAQPDTSFLIGSNSSDANGEYYTIDNQKISQRDAVRNKRTFDILMALFLILFSPFILFKFKNKKRLFKNLFACFIGTKTFVGYSKEINEEKVQLPNLKTGILFPTDNKKNQGNPLTKTNLLYAKNYSIRTDLEIIVSNWKRLDRN
jgi:hypothetical protein